VFTDAFGTVNRIEGLLSEAVGLFDTLPVSVQTVILGCHNTNGTLHHCLRWGLQAATEIRSDWHTVVAGLTCEEVV
jgi:hypothetical protein